MSSILTLIEVEQRKLVADALSHYSDAMRAGHEALTDAGARGNATKLRDRAREAQHLAMQLNQSIGVL